MKVVIINKSDCIGGAAVVSHRLLQALCDNGVDAKMLVMDIAGKDSTNIVEIEDKRKAKIAFLAERLRIFLSNKLSRKNLFKVSTAIEGLDLSNHPLVKEADVIMLNWVNQGMLSLKSIEKIIGLGKPIIWTMHDMWCATGICHLPYECEGYFDGCGNCQYLSSHSKNDLSHKVYQLKKKLYGNGDICFVAVSYWLAERSKLSGLLHDKRVEVIHNTIPHTLFDYSRNIDEALGLPTDKKIIVMGAARLDDAVKGFEYVIELSKYIRTNREHLAEKIHFLFFGTIRNPQLLDQLQLPYTFVGSVTGLKDINRVLRNGDIILSTSFYETFGNTLIEGMASGLVPVTFGNGGQVDIVEHKNNGYIADYRSVESLADGIEWALASSIERGALHDEVVKKFSATTIAGKYIQLCKELIESNNNK